MNNFVFYNPTKIIFGRNTIKNIGSEIKNAGYKRIILLAGGGSIKNNGVYNSIVDSMRREGLEWIEVWGIRPNPVLSKVKEIINLMRSNKIEAILAAGGGSVIDTAKAAAAGYYLEDIWDAFEKKVAIKNALPIFVILTLSATGSEMNPYAVITNEEKKLKWNISSSHLFPKVSIIDPEIQNTLPWKQTVNGAIDALAHIMEYYSLGKNEESVLSIDEALMNTIISMVDKLQEEPKNYELRANLAWSATLALNGISGVALKEGDWSTHIIEHSLSALHPEISHGTGLGIILPAWIQYIKEYNPAVFKRWSIKIWNCETINDALKKLKAKLTKWSAPTSLSELGLNKNDIYDIADNSALSSPFGQLKKLYREDIINILSIAF